MSDGLRVLVVDDVEACRSVLINALGALSGVRIVGTASSGQDALAQLDSLRPDMVLLDVEMPDMDGIATLCAIGKKRVETSVVMVSPSTQSGVEKTMKSLQMGAFDFVSRPADCDPSTQAEKLVNDLRRVVRAFVTRRSVGALSDVLTTTQTRQSARAASSAAVMSKVEVVALGLSTGGPGALDQLMPSLPGDLGVPVLIVQHMPSTFTPLLASMLNRRSALRVTEARDGLWVEENTAYIAQGGRHMRVRQCAEGVVIETTLDPPEQHCRPSVDYLFRSVSEVYGAHALGVIMTGMGSDGTHGLAAMKAKGANVLAQDEKSSTVFGMPGAAAEAGLTDEQLPLDQLANRIVDLVVRSQNRNN